MSKIALKAENISKRYQIGEIGTGTLSRDLEIWTNYFLQKKFKLKTGFKHTQDEDKIVWSLKDINFEINKGDAVGIIGKNGAGKSTLLKILSKITGPTTGKISGQGRIASLLEVGTGFHPELSGRENIFLNGAILGMRKKEIQRKLEEIVDFAGIERYLDTPVKRYSSGMYVRLAFAVAAHLESEILIVDEVLAVGDAEFQKKCLGKMGEVSKGEGRTVLFVSHNMAAVKTLCNKGIVLKDGLLSFEGSHLESIAFYQKNNNTPFHFKHSGPIGLAPGNDSIRLLLFDIQQIKGNFISISSGVKFEIRFICLIPNINLDATFELKNSDELIIFHNGKLISTEKDSKVGIYSVEGIIPPYLLNSGKYTFNLIFGENQKYALLKLEDVISFDIENEAKGANNHQLPGIISPNLSYSVTFEPA